MIDDRNFELFLSPRERVRVASLAGEKQRAQTTKIIATDVIAVGVFAFDRPKGCRRREERADAMLGNHAPEGAGVWSAYWLPFIKHARVAVEEWTINYV